LTGKKNPAKGGGDFKKNCRSGENIPGSGRKDYQIDPAVSEAAPVGYASAISVHSFIIIFDAVSPLHMWYGPAYRQRHAL